MISHRRSIPSVRNETAANPCSSVLARACYCGSTQTLQLRSSSLGEGKFEGIVASTTTHPSHTTPARESPGLAIGAVCCAMTLAAKDD